MGDGSSQRGGPASRGSEQWIPTNEQLINNTDDLEEELRLASVCKSSTEFARVTKHFEILIMAAGLKLGSLNGWLGIEDTPVDLKQQSQRPIEAAAPQADEQPIKNILVTLNGDNLEMPAFLANSKRAQAFVRFCHSKRMLQLRFASAFYITGKLISFAYLCFDYHKQVGGTGEQVRPYVGGSTCTIREEDANQERALRADETIGVWFSRVGVLLAYWPGAGTMIYGILAAMPVVFRILPHVRIRLGQIRLDTLCFLLDPLGQRRRIRAKLNDIIDEILLAAAAPPPNLRHGSDNDDKESGLSRTADAHCVWPRQTFRPRSRFDRRPEAGGTVTSAANDRLGRIHYIQMLHQIRNLNLVQPYIFSSDWHNKALKSCLSFNARLVPSGCLGTILCMLVYLLYELDLRTGYYLRLTECSRKWAATDRLPDSLNRQYRDALQAHDGTWLDRIHLVLVFEVTHYLTPQMLYVFLELSLLLLAVGVWTALFQALFILGALGRVVWLKQIELQLRNTLRLTLRRQRFPEYKLGGGAEPETSSLLESLTVSYLNYELYRRQNNQFQVATNFFGRQTAVLTGVAFSLAYIVAVNIKVEHALPSLLTMLGIVSMMNLYLFAGSYQFKQVQKIMNIIACLLPQVGAAQMPSCDYAMQLWRRQLLTEPELRRFFTSNLFGVSVTYQKCILFNAYLVALFFITLNGPKATSLT